MEPNELTERMISELRTLLAEMQAGNRATNMDLEEAVRAVVSRQMKPAKPRTRDQYRGGYRSLGLTARLKGF